MPSRSVIFLLLALGWFSGCPFQRPQQAHASIVRQENISPCFHKEREAIDFLIGDWNVDANVRLADGTWEHTSATSQIKPDLSGCLLSERFTGTRAGHTFNALALMAFNNTSKKLQRAWSDSEHGLLVMYEGNRSGNEIIMETEILLDGKSVKLRNAYLEISETSFSLESGRSTDGGKTWITVTRMRYRRKSRVNLTLPNSNPFNEMLPMNFCEVIKNAQRYDGKTIRVRAIFWQQFEGAVLSSYDWGSCAVMRAIRDCGADDCKELDQRLRESLGGKTVGHSAVLLVGRFKYRNVVSGDQLRFGIRPYELQISKVEEILKPPERTKQE